MPDGSTRGGRRLPMPDWPLLMDLPTAARFLDLPTAEFKLLMVAGSVPPGRELRPGTTRWHREELERCMARLFRLTRDAETDAAQAQAELRQRIANHQPAAARRPEARRGR